MAETESLEANAVAIDSTLLDPLLCNVELPLRGFFHPRGFTVEITTNSPEVLAGAQESWGQFQQEFPEPPLQFRVGVMGAGNGVCPPIPTCRAWRNLLLNLADAENYAVCDLRRGIAFAWLTQSAAENIPYLRYNFLEACVLSMVEKMYLVPVHGACVRFQGRGVLLCGDSGAGKSSLAYACARRGWTFVADDASALIRNCKEPTILGSPHQIRFREAGVELFPELSMEVATPRVTGEMAIELATSKMPEISTALRSSADHIVFLNRRDPDPPCLVPISKHAALPWFERVICFGEEETRQAQRASLRKLLEKPVMELRYRDLDWAVDRLETLVREGV
jgi:hypothetical protein